MVKLHLWKFYGKLNISLFVFFMDSLEVSLRDVLIKVYLIDIVYIVLLHYVWQLIRLIILSLFLFWSRSS